MVGWSNGAKNTRDGDGVLKSKQIHGNGNHRSVEESVAMKLLQKEKFVTINSS